MKKLRMGLNRKTRAALSFGPPKMGWEGADCKCKQPPFRDIYKKGGEKP